MPSHYQPTYSDVVFLMRAEEGDPSAEEFLIEEALNANNHARSQLATPTPQSVFGLRWALTLIKKVMQVQKMMPLETTG